MKKYYLTSILLHILLLGISLASGQGSGASKKQGNGLGQEGQNENIIARPATVVDIIEIADQDEEGQEKPKEDAVNCKDWFGGIGVEMFGFDTIAVVYKGYPADKAGIKAGDIISSRSGEIRGEPGTNVLIIIQRKELTLTFNITRDKICYDGMQPVPK